MKFEFVNIDQFNRGVNDFVEKLDNETIPLFIRGLAIRVLSGVVRRTPVDSGRARGNWQLEIGSITGTEIESGFSNARGDDSRVVTEGLAKLRALGKQGIGSVIYIYNNVRYIIELEDGSSSQAPIGMVRVTMAEILAGIDPSIGFIETAERLK